MVLGTLHQNRAAALFRRLGFVATDETETHTLFRLDPLTRAGGACHLPLGAHVFSSGRRMG